jgi:7,8-dihydro-6-hydroxymethylpterin-pyrophosphokinase
VPLTAIALGSNLGDRRAHLEWAVDRLRELLTNLRVSSFIETEPVDVPDGLSRRF